MALWTVSFGFTVRTPVHLRRLGTSAPAVPPRTAPAPAPRPRPRIAPAAAPPPAPIAVFLARLARPLRLLRPWYTTVWPGFLTTTWATAGVTIGSRELPKSTPTQVIFFITCPLMESDARPERRARNQTLQRSSLAACSFTPRDGT